MRGRRAISLAVEWVESRVLQTSHAFKVPAIVSSPHVLSLQATVAGSFVGLPHAPGYVTPYAIHGSANLPGLGMTAITGQIDGRNDQITLKTRRGEIVVGNFADAYSINPHVTYEFGFHVIQGTGAYQNEAGGGFLGFTLSPPQGPKGRLSLTIDSHASAGGSSE